MNRLQSAIAAVAAREERRLMGSTFAHRRRSLRRLERLGEEEGFDEPCQELYDAFVALAASAETRGQHIKAVRLVDEECGTRAVMPGGGLYNPPALPTAAEAEAALRGSSFPIGDASVDAGALAVRALEAMRPLRLSDSTTGQYRQAWREYMAFLAVDVGDARYSRASAEAFMGVADAQLSRGEIKPWKWKIRARSLNVLREVADTGSFEWKCFARRPARLDGDGLEALRRRYSAHLESRNLGAKTVELHDYALRLLLEGCGAAAAGDLRPLGPEQVRRAVAEASGRLCANSLRTVLPMMRAALSWLHESGYVGSDCSGAVVSPPYRRPHLRPYLDGEGERRLLDALEGASARDRAMVLLALRLGLREGDVCSLTFGQIDWENDRIAVEQRKTGARLELPLLDDVGNAIMDYLVGERPAAAGPCPHVFVRTQAPFRRLDGMYPIVSRLVGEAGAAAVNGDAKGAHLLRHTLAYKLLKAKVPRQVVTGALGHASAESDKPYLAMDEAMLRECPLDLSLMGRKRWGGASS